MAKFIELKEAAKMLGMSPEQLVEMRDQGEIHGYRDGGSPPIVDSGQAITTFAGLSVDPLPQALVLTSIVIGLGVLALMVALCVRLYERYGTFDVTKIRRLRG